jgi:hypothetical protein
MFVDDVREWSSRMLVQHRAYKSTLSHGPNKNGKPGLAREEVPDPLGFSGNELRLNGTVFNGKVVRKRLKKNIVPGE